MAFLFNDWSTFFRTLLIGTMAYVVLILVLRIFGKHILAKMNAFDFVVTVAFGSIVASILTNSKLSLADGVTALTLLVFLQYVLSNLTIRFKVIDKMVKSEPNLVYFKGEFDHQAMKKERILKEELYQAARSSGFCSMDDVFGIILETNGEFSVLSNSTNYPKHSTLESINKNNFKNKH